jgi:hypothetical protein
MGDSISEGTIREWKKAVGEAVKVDDVVAVIETDKVRALFESPHAHAHTHATPVVTAYGCTPMPPPSTSTHAVDQRTNLRRRCVLDALLWLIMCVMAMCCLRR